MQFTLLCFDACDRLRVWVRISQLMFYRFGNYAHNRRTLMKNTLRQLRQLASEVTGSTNPCEQSSCPQYIPPNSIVRLTLGPIQRSLADAIVSHGTTASLTQTPLTLWSLLPYERCMSVLHMTLQKRRLQEEGTWVQQQQSSSNMVDPDPIMAKEPMLFQVRGGLLASVILTAGCP